MSAPRVPGSRETEFTLSCGELVSVTDFDMGMREFQCPCGSSHAVVMDVHPLGRWIPESIADVFRETIETTDEFEAFGTMHLMGIVLEEFPEAVTSEDCTDHEQVGWALLWVTEFDSRRLHEIVVELLVELMDHAMSHSGDGDSLASFEEHLLSFDVEAFVDEYRQIRDFESEFDAPV